MTGRLLPTKIELWTARQKSMQRRLFVGWAAWRLEGALPVPELPQRWRLCRVTAGTARLCAILAAAQVVGLAQEIHQTSLADTCSRL